MVQHVVISHCTDTHDSWFHAGIVKPPVVCWFAVILPDGHSYGFLSIQHKRVYQHVRQIAELSCASC